MPAAEILNRQIKTADGIILKLIEAGQGRPLLFVSGWTMTSEIWQEQIDAFSKTHRVIALDPRGQGGSSKPSKGFDSIHRAADIAEVVSQLKLENAVLIGWSLGAVDAVNYLQRHQDKGIAALALIDNSVDKNYTSGQTGANTLQRLNNEPYETVIADFIPTLFKKPQSAARIEQLKKLSMQTPLEAAKESLTRATTGKGLVAALAARPLPVLYAVTSRFAEEGRKIKAVLGDSFTLEVFEDSGHALFVDDAPRFNAALSALIQRIV